MRQSRNRLVTMAASVAALGLAITGGASALAQEQEASPAAVFDPRTIIPAHVHAGTCGDLGDIAFPLDEAGYGLPVPVGPEVRPGTTPAAVEAALFPTAGVNPAAVGVTAITATLDQLLDTPHAVTAYRGMEGAEAETQIACGAVGGYRTGDDLVFGLQERNGSAYVGTAWLHDNRDGTTTVSLFLASGLREDAATAAVVRSGEAVPAAGGVDVSAATNQDVALAVAGSVFGAEELVLREGGTTTLRVANGDDLAYRLRIGDLVTSTPIVAGGVTQIHFTTPTDAVYKGQLLHADEDRVLDALRVVVRKDIDAGAA
ncbi:MAG: hypothetical protein AVDCRST_MAG19-1666 [uncultured Thermomicrobiales bacterium]|uniref:Secreted protein n=1 Tax=uncultured Thermomicrobiales bacterium TaxID=1645740 RepID=A0A6J4USL1_9BACT|nr:MAG: hypothetical protein AVDCRST_MAG19-1666 [uncultured Thermomicrobiales bacterium]